MRTALRRLGCVTLASLIWVGVGGLVASWSAASDERPVHRGGGASVLVVAQKPTAKKKARPKRAPTKAHPKKGQPKDETTPEPDSTSTTPADDGTLKFSRDIAPVLVGNCVGCHNPEKKKGKFDLTTFQKLMAGSESRKVIIPGNPDESPLIQRVEGDETPKMPPGQKNLAPETIAKIKEWIKAGALLDAKMSPTATLASFAVTPEKRQMDELAKMSPEERDKKAESVARDRWKKAVPGVTPEMTSSEHFLLFGKLPKPRAAEILKLLEGRYAMLRGLLSMPGKPALQWPEKLSLYVFNDAGGYAEFVRSVESRELEQGVVSHGNMAVETPYLAAIDPLAGQDDPNLGKKPSPRSKHHEEPTGPERSLEGLLTEELGSGAVAQSGKPPLWLTLGLGTYLASQVEPRSPYFRRLRAEVFAQSELGWGTKANEALGGEADTAKIRAMGFSLFEWMTAEYRPMLRNFILVMLEGQGKLDDAVKLCWGEGTGRNEFLDQWGYWVAQRYGRGR